MVKVAKRSRPGGCVFVAHAVPCAQEIQVQRPFPYVHSSFGNVFALRTLKLTKTRPTVWYERDWVLFAVGVRGRGKQWAEEEVEREPAEMTVAKRWRPGTAKGHTQAYISRCKVQKRSQRQPGVHVRCVEGMGECGRKGGVWKGPLLCSGCLYIYLQLTLNVIQQASLCVQTRLNVSIFTSAVRPFNFPFSRLCRGLRGEKVNITGMTASSVVCGS